MKHFLPHFVQIKNQSLSVGDHLNQWPPSHTVEHYTTGKKADRALRVGRVTLCVHLFKWEGEGPLSRYIWKKTLVSAVASREGTRDEGVGGRRLSFLFGQFVF